MRLAVGILGLSVGCGPSSLDKVCDPGEVCVIAGTGELGFNGDDGPATALRLASPTAVKVSPDGVIHVVDYSNMRVRVLHDDGDLETVVGSGFHAYSEIGAASLDTPLENPVDVAWLPDGTLCVLPQHEGRLICVASDNTIDLRVGTGEIEDRGDGGAATEANLGYTGGVAVLPSGEIYITDQSHSRVRMVDRQGIISTVLGVGSAGLGSDGYGPEVALRFPERVVYDTNGARLLVSDAGNHRVVAMDLETLEVVTIIGTGVAGFSGDGGPATAASVNRPTDVVPTPEGGLLISDTRNHRIRYVDPDGTVSTVAGSGERGHVARPLERLEAPVDGPAGMALTDDGDLLIAAQFGHTVLRVRQLVDEL